MAMKFLKNRVEGNQHVFEIHLDTEKLDEQGQPHAEWVDEHRWGLDVDPDEALAETMLLVKAALDLRRAAEEISPDEGTEFDPDDLREKAKKRLEKKKR